MASYFNPDSNAAKGMGAPAPVGAARQMMNAGGINDMYSQPMSGGPSFGQFSSQIQGGMAPPNQQNPMFNPYQQYGGWR